MTAPEQPVNGFQLLQVHRAENAVRAVLPYRRLFGRQHREELENDFQRLCALSAAVVELDLRSVQYIDGSFGGLVVRLAKLLSETGRPLTVYASADLEQVFRVARMDRVFTIVGESGTTTPADRDQPDEDDD